MDGLYDQIKSCRKYHRGYVKTMKVDCKQSPGIIRLNWNAFDIGSYIIFSFMILFFYKMNNVLHSIEKKSSDELTKAT